MHKKLLTIFFTTCLTLSLSAQQNDPVAFTINGNPVYKSEVEKAYQKSNENRNIPESIDEFIESYIDFRRNLEEAKFQKLDTVSSYQDAFDSYRMQLVNSFVKDTVHESRFINKIYNRFLENVEMNHIMIPFENEVTFPADTIAIYNKAMEIRTKILQNGFTGEEFNKNSAQSLVAGLETRSGYIGWVSPFMFPFKVEDAAYSLPLNEISMPIRSSKGYHIIQVLNKRKNEGAAEVEQVVFSFTRIPPTPQQIDSVGKVAYREYENLKSEYSFDDLCEEFSKVHQTGDKGCYFGVVDLNTRLPYNFINAALNLQNNGDISEPMLTDYGYHIIRLLRKIPLPNESSLKQQIRSRIQESDKLQELSEDRRKHLMNTFNFKVNNEVYSKLNLIASTISPRDSVFLSGISNSDEILFEIDEKRKYHVKDFARYLRGRQKALESNPDELKIMQISEVAPYSLSTDILKEYFDAFAYVLLLNYEKATLEERDPLFRDIIEDFSNGLLIFEVKNRNIWNRSTTDQNGLKEIFNKNKSRYTLEKEKYKGTIIYAKNEEALKEAEAITKKGLSNEQLIQAIRETINKDSVLVKIEPGLWEKGRNAYVDNKIFNGSEPKPYPGYPYFFVTGKFINKPEDYTDVKNMVEGDYQEQLEKEWNSYLKNKYAVTINKSVLGTIK